jgi:hypothetical protein
MKSFESLVGASTRAAMHQNRQIKQLISRIVPATLSQHMQFCRLDAGRLRITVDSAAWIARLRFTDRQIIDELRRHNLDVHTISYHVARLEQTKGPKVQRNRAPLTYRSVATIAAAAGNVGAEKDGDEDRLRQALLNLAEKMRRSQS